MKYRLSKAKRGVRHICSLALFLVDSEQAEWMMMDSVEVCDDVIDCEGLSLEFAVWRGGNVNGPDTMG